MGVTTLSKQVTILVPNYKTPEVTMICMRMLRKHTDFSRVHVIAIDNDSADVSLDYLRSLNWIELIERKAVPGETPVLSHAHALDLALQRVETPYVLSIHTDTFVKHHDWLDLLLRPFTESGNVAGVGSWKLESKSWLRELGITIEQFWKWGLSQLTSYKGYKPERFDASAQYLRSHCAIYRTDVIRQLNTGFSDSDQTAGKTMHRKMVAAGYQMLFLESRQLGRYIDHLNHATSVLNPELGSKPKNIREGHKRIQAKLRGIDAMGILAADHLDHGAC
jgi:hypothetical protein